MRRSEGFSTTSPSALASGRTATVQAEVWMRPWSRWPALVGRDAAGFELELGVGPLPIMRA